MDCIHLPVLVTEVIDFLRCRSGCVYVDCTVGMGGHTEKVLEASAPDGRVIGIDQDEEALARARERVASYGDRVRLVHANFVDLGQVLSREGFSSVDGILFDLGVSSYQLEDGERGFSFQKDGPLDMRMDRRRSTRAADLVNALSEKELVSILAEYGEERWAARIARAIVRERRVKPILRTGDLVRVIRCGVPARHGRIHPATRSFLALRIVTNQELACLEKGIAAAASHLAPGGRLCVISFHSLEDRIVKLYFRRLEREGCRVLTKRPVRPGREERMANPRSRSARLRVIEMGREGLCENAVAI